MTHLSHSTDAATDRAAPGFPAGLTSTFGTVGTPGPDAVRDLVAHSLEEDQAEQVVTIDLAGRTSFADFMVVASGRSTRHVGALAENLAARLKQAGVSVPEMEGMPQCDWVLVDAGDVIVHLFRAETRSFYNLEKLWRFEPEEIPGAAVATVMTPAPAAPQVTANPARRFTVRTAGMTVGVR